MKLCQFYGELAYGPPRCPYGRNPSAGVCEICHVRNEIEVDTTSAEAALRQTFEADEQLWGDRLAALIKKHGWDKVAASFTALTGFSCGCESRQRWLNALHVGISKLLDSASK